MGVHCYRERIPTVSRIKVRVTVNVLGLRAGQEAEIEYTQRVDDLLRAGLLLALKPNGQNVSV
jgi:hypothetical protein